MNIITYVEASNLLRVKMETIKQAVSKGNLTRCLLKGKTAFLVFEQVVLFDGKKISVRDLSFEDRKKWELYKKIAETPALIRQTGFSDEEALEIFTAKDVSREYALTAIDREVDNLKKTIHNVLTKCEIKAPPELDAVYP